MSGVLAEFLGLSPASQAVVLLVIGTAAWIVIRLTLRVLRLLLGLLPARKPPVAAPEPRQAAQGCAAGWCQPASSVWIAAAAGALTCRRPPPPRRQPTRLLPLLFATLIACLCP